MVQLEVKHTVISVAGILALTIVGISRCATWIEEKEARDEARTHRVENLTAFRAHLTEIDGTLEVVLRDQNALIVASEVLARTAIDDRSDVVSPIRRSRDAAEELRTGLQEVARRISSLEEMSLDSQEARRDAQVRATSIREDLDRLANLATDVRSQVQETRSDVAKAVAEEYDLLHLRLAVFHELLGAYLAGTAARESTLSANDVNLFLSSARLARLAGIVYSGESLIRKGERLFSSPPPMAAMIQALDRADPRDLARVRDELARGELRRPPSLAALASGGSPVGPELSRVAAQELNVRSGPGTANRVLFRLIGGDLVEVLEKPGTWWRIASRKGEGWLNSRYLELLGQ